MKITADVAAQIQSLRDSGLGYKSIGGQLDLKSDTVRKHCQKVAHLALLPPKEKRYRGTIKGRNPLRIKQFIRSNATATLTDIITACDLAVSPSTLSTYLKRAGMPKKVAKSRIVLSNVNKRKRVAFAKEWVLKSDEELAQIWFSDETMVKSPPNGEYVFFRCPPGAEWHTPSNGSGSKSVMFWGVISKAAYGPLVQVEGKNTAVKYISTLTDHLLPEVEAAEGPVIFQQDNASIHKTAAVMAFLEENEIQTFEWPPQSPDLSPIENVWNVMKMKMKALNPRPRTMATMREACLEIWNELEDRIRIGLIDGFRGRLTKCIKAKGNIIKF
jgi:transposase